MNTTSLSPIALFAFNRPDHLAQTLSALAKNKYATDSKLFIFCDGSRGEKDDKGVSEVRKVAHEAKGFLEVTVIEASKNKGLAQSIISGVSELSIKFGKVIVVEDDLVTSPYFLQYMNEGLEKFKDDERVISLHGYMYPVSTKLSKPFFLKGADCWGWATWERGWKLFNPDAEFLLNEIETKKIGKVFDLDGSYPYVQMLKDFILKKNNSWAIRWHASAFLANKLTLYPHQSLVQNIGFDGAGTHCSVDTDFEISLAELPISLEEIKVEESEIARKSIISFYRRRNNFFSKAQRVLRRYFT